LKFDGTPVTYVNAPGAAGININGRIEVPIVLLEKIH